MGKFNLDRNVPNVFSYPLSRREVKYLAIELPMIEEFNYIGVSPREQVNDHGQEVWLGYVIGKKTESEWHFSLSLYASRNEHLAKILDQAKIIIKSDARKWITMQLSQPESYPDGSNTLDILLTNKQGVIKSSSTEYKKTEWHLVQPFAALNSDTKAA